MRRLGSISECTFQELVDFTGLGKSEVLWALENLLASGAVEVKKERAMNATLTEEGELYASSTLPEESLIKKLQKSPMKANEMHDGKMQIGFLWAKKKGLVEISNGHVMLTKSGERAAEEGMEDGALIKSFLHDSSISKKDEPNARVLEKRGLITIKERAEISSIRITAAGRSELKNGQSEHSSSAEIGSLEKSMITTGSWSGKKFKGYDINIGVERSDAAVRHPLRMTINELKRTYTSMGFTEVSGPVIEPSFWVFDSLFVPQDHPARDVQDTFYLSNPEKMEIGEDVGKIRRAHTKAWKSKWDPKVAEQAVLRTHTTNVSIRYVNNVIRNILANTGDYTLPIKFFSVGRVFRNENIDYKHLADFYQTDGIIIGKGLTFANLFDTLIKIYGSFGIKVKFKPSYFPFVEPGTEVYAYSENAKEWIEMGGAGIIRNEITGVTRKNITVLAWGLGIERLLLMRDPTLKSVSELYNGGVGWLRQRKMV